MKIYIALALFSITSYSAYAQTGNVGIGTSAPDSKLHVEGNFKLVNGSQGDGKILTSDANGLSSWQTPATVAVPSYYDWLKAGDALPTASGDNNGAIYHDGSVAIGTTNTAPAKFRIVSNSDDVANEYHLDDYQGTTSKYNAIRFHKARGTEASPQNLVLNDYLGAIEFNPRFAGNASTYSNGSGMTAIYRGSGSNNLTALAFFTSSNMPQSGEKMRIDELGHEGGDFRSEVGTDRK